MPVSRLGRAFVCFALASSFRLLEPGWAGWDEWQSMRIIRYEECRPGGAPNREIRSGRTPSSRSGAPDRLEACVAFAMRRLLAEKTAGIVGLVAFSRRLDQTGRRRRDGRRCRPQPCSGKGCRVGSGDREGSRSGREGMASRNQGLRKESLSRWPHTQRPSTLGRFGAHAARRVGSGRPV